MHLCVLSCVRLFANPWPAARQAPLLMEFSRQEYWSGFPFHSPGDCLNPGTEPRVSCFLHCQADSATGATWELSTTWFPKVFTTVD